MKNLYPFVLLLFVMSLFACNIPVETKLRGTWQIDSIYVENEQALKVDYKAIKKQIKERSVFTFYPGHTYEYEFNNNSKEGVWELSKDKRYLITKYNDGYINLPRTGKAVGYPKEWRDAVGYGKLKLKK